MSSSSSARALRRPGKLKAGDIALVALVIAAAVVSLQVLSRANASKKGSLAVIAVNGKEVKRVALGDGMRSRKFVVRGAGGATVVEVSGGRARVLTSHCRDKICVGVGWIDSPGKAVICLPNRVVLRITGSRGGNGKVDTVTE